MGHRKLNVLRKQLVKWNKVLLPVLHIELGLVKKFAKVFDHAAETFQKINLIFSKLYDVKIKGYILIWPQINEVEKKLERKMTYVEKEAWCAICNSVTGNHKEPEDKQLLANFI